MAKVIGDLCAPTGKYIKDGEEKTSWTKCGIVMETEKGLRVKLLTVPVGGSEQGIWFSVFEKREQNTGQQSQARPAQKPQDDQDDIPF